MKQISKIGIGALWILMLSVIGIYIFYILYHAEWLIGDDAFMINRTAFGVPFSLSESIIPNNGFFRPFDYLHENIVLLFHGGMHSAFEHYIINAVSFMLCIGALIGILWKTVKPKDVCDHAIIALGTIVIASRLIGVYINIFGPIFSVYTYHMLAIFFLCVFLEKDKTWAMVLSLLCWAYSILIYENVCVAVGSMGLFPLLFAYKQLNQKQRIYYYVLIGMVVVFLVTYLLVIYLPTRGQTHYDPTHYSGVGFLENAKNMLMGQKFIIVAAMVWLWRQIQLLRKQTNYHILYDTLLWAAGGAVAGALILRLNWTMYYYDAIILSLPAIVYFLINSNEKHGKYIALSVAIIFAALHSRNILRTIRRNQKDRIETAYNMRYIAEKAQAGWAIVWNNGAYTDDVDRTKKEWRENVTLCYIQYLLKDKQWSYARDVNTPSIVFNPIENENIGLIPSCCEGVKGVYIGVTSGVTYYVIE